MNAPPADDPTVFVSYRRQDRPGHAGRIQDALRSRFGRDRVFYDVTTVQGGADFALAIRDAIDRSTVVAAIIGPDWSRRRFWRSLLGRTDWVAFEIEYARRAGKPILPVLVDNARMPRSLPPRLAFLETIHAVPVRDESWDSDVEVVVSRLPQVRPSPGAAPVPERNRRPAAIAAALVLVAAVAGAGWLLNQQFGSRSEGDVGNAASGEPSGSSPSAASARDPAPSGAPPESAVGKPGAPPSANAPADRTAGRNRPPVGGGIAVDQFNGVGLVSATRFTLRAKEASDPDGDALQYRWDLGDGSPSPPSNPVVTKVYDRVSAYTVRLFVTDGKSPEVAAGEAEITVRDLSGTWLLEVTPDPAATYRVPTHYEVTLLQQGNQLTGRIMPLPKGPYTLLSGKVQHPLRVNFGSESAWWNDSSDAYFNMEVSDGFLMTQMRSDPKLCSYQVPCAKAFMRKQ